VENLKIFGLPIETFIVVFIVPLLIIAGLTLWGLLYKGGEEK